MRKPDYNKIRIILSQDNNDDYMSMSDEDVLYEFVKQFGNKIPKKEKVMNEYIECKKCDGTGHDIFMEGDGIICPKCNGSGEEE